MKLDTILSMKKESKWIHYNLINQTMIETPLSPSELEKISGKIREELLFASDKEFLIKFNRDYYQKIREEITKRREISNPFRPKSEVVFTLWYDCNFACPYCFQQYKYYDRRRGRTSLNIDKAIGFMKNKSKNGEFPPQTVILIGGEPLLESAKHNKEIEKILSFLDRTFPGIVVHIVSNGYSLEDYSDLLTQYKNLDYIITVTFGVNREKHKEHRILRSDERLDTSDKLIKGLKKYKEVIPEGFIYIRMNFGKEYRNKETTISLMREIKKELPDAHFELGSIISNSSHLEFSEDYLNLIVELVTSEEFSKSLFLKLPESIFFLLRNTIPEMEVNKINSKPKICNAVSFTTNYDLATDFQVQPCEDFSYYTLQEGEYLEISSEILETLDKRVEDCVDCPFFIRCIASPCNIIKKQNTEKMLCYSMEKYPYQLVLDNLYH